MFKLSDIYQAIIGMLVRFFDHRFQQVEDQTLYILKLELERERAEKSKLLDSILSSSRSDSQPSEVATPMPVGQMNWKAQARKLEAESRAKRQQMIKEAENSIKNNSVQQVNPEAMKSVEALEEELGIN